MKRKSTKVEKTLQQDHGRINWKDLRKRLLVMGLTVAMVGNTIDFSSLSVSAKTETGETTIVSFEKLSKDIAEQTLPIGASESDINFPDSLTVTVEKIVQVEKDKEDTQDETDTDETETGDEDQNDTDPSKGEDEENGEEENSGNIQNPEDSDKEDDSNKSDSSDVEGQNVTSDKSDEPDNTDSHNTEDTQARAGLPSVFGAFLGQMADILLPHKLVAHAAEKDDVATDASSETGSSDKNVNTTGSSDTTVETEIKTEEILLKNIEWELDPDESDAEKFDSSKASNGFCYAYTPVLPETDDDGNQFVLGEDVELPTIYVLVGEYGIAPLADDAKYQAIETDKEGNETTNTGSSDSALVSYLRTLESKNLEKVSIKLLADCEIKPSSKIEISNKVEEMILDLNGKTLTISLPSNNSDKGVGLVFENGSTTITSSASGGKIEGTRNSVEGYGLITVDNGSELDIENVTIENKGTAPTVIVGLTANSEEIATCTITDSTIIGQRSGGIVRAQNGGYAECTIGKGTTIRSTLKGCLCIGFYNAEGSSKNSEFIIEDGAVLNSYSRNDYVIDISANDYANVIINGGTFNGKLQTAKKDTVKISGGTFGENVTGDAVSVNYDGGTLQDLMEESYCLKASDGTEIDLTKTGSGSVNPVTAAHLPLYIEMQPSIDEDMAIVAKGYTEAPELTVKAVSTVGDISYQWYVNKTVGETTTSDEKVGANSAVYQIPTGLLAGTYKYYCVATAGGKEVTSKTVTFTVGEAYAETTINGKTKTQLSLEKALTEISEAGENAATLKILKDIDSETFDSKEISGDVTIDLNGHAVGYKGDGSDWQTGIDKFGFRITGGTVTLTDSSTSKTGYLHGTLQVNGGKFSLENGTCENLNISAGTATISGGACKTVEVNSGATLKVTGEDAKITTLKALHKADARAEVTLSGGHFGSIAVEISGKSEEQEIAALLSDETAKLAIEDMLASDHAFYDNGDELQEIDRTTTTVTDVTVRSSIANAENAVVRIDVTKTDGTVASTYYASWKLATNYLSDKSPAKSEFGSWKSVKIALLKDAKINKDVEPWGDASLRVPVTICSENGTHTLTGGGYTTVLESALNDITLQDIKITGAYIRVADGDLTLEEGVEVSGAPYKDAVKSHATIKVSNGELKLEDATVTATTEGDGIYAVDLYEATLRMSASSLDRKYLTSAYIGDKEVTAVIDAGSAGYDGSNLPAFYGNTTGNAVSKLKIYFTGTKAYFDTALANYTGESEVWYRITLNDGATLVEDKNKDTVTRFEETIYGLYNKNKEANPNNVIYVGDNACQYHTNTTLTNFSSDRCFSMPASSVIIYAHDWQEDGQCSKCNQIDIERAYKNKALTIEGLEGRTYDSYPQILSKITWKSENGTVKELTAPMYDKNGFGTLGFGGDKPQNSNADYTVVYKNNVQPYTLKEGDAGFNKEAAPQVTITGISTQGYIGSLTIYFTIGAGEMSFGDFGVCGADGKEIPYTGKTHKAWEYNYKAILFKPDPCDKGQFSQLGDDEYIASCDRTAADEWFGADWENPTKVEYSTDNQTTWKTVIEYGQAGDMETPYMITDAGEYPFYIRVTNKDCGITKVSDELTAKITPRDLSQVTFDNTQNVTAYYTGKEIIPTAWDDKLVDKGLKDETGTVAAPEYTLVRDKDFIITAENNTDVSTTGILGGNSAKVTITGTGNYKGDLSAEFQIKSAFTLKQTTASTVKWYMKDPSYWTDDGVPVVFSEYNTGNSGTVLPFHMQQIVYRYSKEDDANLGDQVEFYTSLEDAIAGTNPGYTFKKEGSHTVKLWGKDPETGYISEPVEVTLKIDTTAPVWTDEDGNEGEYGIQIQENWWRKLLNFVTFGHLYNNHTLEIKIKANDKKKDVNGVSGLDQNDASYYCYIQEIDDTAAGGEVPVKTKEELDSLEHGGSDVNKSFIRVSPGNGGVGTNQKIDNALKNDGNYIVYAYAVDAAGNKSDYISTEGIIVDMKAPELTVLSESKIKDTEAVIPVELDEDATLLYFYVDESLHNLENVGNSTYDDLAAQSTGAIWQYVQPLTKADGPLAKCENGKWAPPFTESGDLVTIANPNGSEVKAPAYKVEAKEGTTEIQITGLQPSEKFQIWMAAIDKAGNFSGYIIGNFNTTKAMPKVTTLPEVSGVYGDTFAELKVKAGVAEYGGEEIDGEWKITSTGNTPLQVGDTTQCEVTFTPDAKYNDKYEATVVNVTPTIAPRPITIKVADMHKVYGDPCPGIDDLDFLVDENTLVAGDTRETIKKDLVIYIPENASKPDSICGRYSIAFKLENKNYKVIWKYYEKLTDSDTVEYCLLVIEKAAGEINTLPEFKATQNVQYQYEGEFATFNLGAEAGHKEAALQYTITDAKKANGDTITDAAEIANKLLSISADGKVTIKGAGSAKIMISLPESTNYTAAKPLTVDVNIKKADITIPEFAVTSVYSNKSVPEYNMISKNGLNVERLGTVIYGDGSGDNETAIAGMTIKINGTVVNNDTAIQEFFDKVPYLVGNAKITCAIKKFDTYEPKTAIVTIPVTTENCTINGGAGIVFNLQKVDKLTVQPKAEVEAARALTYGEALSKISFKKVTFVDAADNSITVPGTLEWETPDAVLAVGTHQVKYIFKPKADADYKQYEGTVTVTVNKAKAKLTKAPVPDTCIYNPSAVFSEDILNNAKEQGFVAGANGSRISGTWHFADSAVTTKPLKVGKSSYEIYFTPDAAYEANYDCDAIKATVTITVKKAVPYIGTQPANTYTHGDYLYSHAPAGAAIHGNGMGSAGTGTGADTSVAGTFKWKKPSTKVTYLGNKTFDYVFTPEDTASYEAVTGSVTVTVNKAANAPFMPGSSMNVAHSCKTVGSVKLPQGWKWSDTDAATALADDTTISATAVYDGADKGSYVNETVTIQITRANCEHAKTTAKGTVKATCIAEGSTGETWCQVCNVKLSDGVTTPKDAKNHTALVSKQLRPATTAQEGIMSYSCADCGYYEEKPIAKITTGGGSSDSGNNSSSGEDSGSGSGDGSNSGSGSPLPVIKPEPKPAPTPTPSVKPSDNNQKPHNNKPAAGDQTAEDKQPQPYIRGKDGKEGWDVIKAEVDVCADGDTIVVDMNGSSVVPGDIFDEIRGKDITIEFDLGNGISWRVNGKSVQKDKVGDIDFRVTLGEEAADTIPVDIVNALTGERYSMNLTLAYEGEFGFEAILRANLGAENKGLVANLFYYDQSAGALEFISAGEIDEDGYTELVFTHASDYTIVIDTVSMEEQATATDVSGTDMDADNADTLPAQEDADASETNNRTALIWLIIFAGIAIAAVSVVVVKTRKKEKQ